MDSDVQELLERWGVIPDNPIHRTAWQRESLRGLCRISPMVAIKRKDGFHVLGSGRLLRLAQEVFVGDEELPILKVTATRVARQVKLDFLAIELFGYAALYRSRQEMPSHLFKLWRMLEAEGVFPITDRKAKAFALATGFSQASINKARSTQPSTVANQKGS